MAEMKNSIVVMKDNVKETIQILEYKDKEMANKRKDKERVSWDKVREWHGHIHTTKRKIDS